MIYYIVPDFPSIPPVAVDGIDQIPKNGVEIEESKVQQYTLAANALRTAALVDSATELDRIKRYNFGKFAAKVLGLKTKADQDAAYDALILCDLLTPIPHGDN